MDWPMDLIPLKFAAETLGLSTGYLRTLCRARRVPGAVFDGRRWYLPNGAKVIRKTSGLYRTEPEPAESRKQAELESRMQRLAAALAVADGGAPPEEGDGST